MEIVESAGGFMGGRFFVIVRVDFKWFWGLSPPKKRIELRGSGWLGNGWNIKKALLDSRPREKLDFCYAWPG